MSEVHQDRATNRESGVALVSIVVVIMALLAIVSASINLEIQNNKMAGDQATGLQADLIAQAALHQSYREIASMVDTTDYGLGAIGCETPAPFTDTNGAIFGEFSTYVINNGDGTADIRAIAAVPNFQDARSVRTAEARIGAIASWEFAPRPGAMVVSGPSSALDLQWTGNGANVLIDGGNAPAISTTDTTSFDLALDGWGGLMESGTLDNTELVGGMTSTYSGAGGDIEVPVMGTEVPTQDVTEMNDYRNQLRTAALSLAAVADRSLNTVVLGDQTWGTAAAPEVTYLDATGMVNLNVFGTPDQTVTGHGTLIIEGNVMAMDNLNLDWNGDIFIVGNSAGGMNLVSFQGLNGTVNGNIVFVSQDNGEGSVQLTDSLGASPRSTDLTVNGAMFMISDVTNNKVELSIDKTSSLEVNGLLGMMGSEINIVTQTADTSLSVNGSLALQMPVDNGPGQLHNPLFFRAAGDLSLVYDQSLARQASMGLGTLEQMYNVSGNDQLIVDRFMFYGTIQSPVDEYTALTQFESMWQTTTSGDDLGYDATLITATPTLPGGGGGGGPGGGPGGGGNPN